MSLLPGLSIFLAADKEHSQVLRNMLVSVEKQCDSNSLIKIEETHSLFELKPLHTHHFDLVLAYFGENNWSEDALSHLVKHSHNSFVILIVADSLELEVKSFLKIGICDYLIESELNERAFQRCIRFAFDRREYQNQFLQISNIDPVTGLPNRRGFHRYLERKLDEAKRLDLYIGLLYINVDKFKLINDTCGQKKGDDYLSRLAVLIRLNMRSSDFLARLGGDEFAVVLTANSTKLSTFSSIAEKILQSLHRGVTLSSGEILEGKCSIGITQYFGNHRHINTDHLLSQAQAAMLSMKKRGGDGFTFFDETLAVKAIRRIQLLKCIRIAFKKGEFYLNYQPIMEASTDRVRGYETLLRWQRENGEIVRPDEFVPILEETGMIHVLGAWVLQKACEDFSQWLSNGDVDERSWISVNLSPVQLLDISLIDRIKEVITHNGLDAHQLHIEITESSLMEYNEYTFDLLAKIKRLGCKLALDDFGVGYSSMNHLKQLPIDTLKIDQSFIRHYRNDPSDQAIIRAMVSLAQNLGKTVVAEGVETQASANFLKQRRCDYLQGFLYAKPMSYEAVIQFTRMQNRKISNH